MHASNIYLRIPGGFARVASPSFTENVTQAGRHAETRKRVDIYTSASVVCARATGAGQTVCDTDRQAGTRKRVDIYKSGGFLINSFTYRML